MKLSGHTTPYAVLGHPIGHSLSPVMHNAAFAALGLDSVYLAFDVAPERLMSVLPAMADMGFGGVNLTVPLKEIAFRGLDEKDTSADRLGSVNTVEFATDGLKGHSTDGAGFLQAVNEAFGASVRGLSVLMLGCGGAGRAVAITCACESAGTVTLCDLDEERARRTATEIGELAPSVRTVPLPAEPGTWRDACREADLVVQATPVGMRPGDESPLSTDAFRAGQLAIDLIYMYPRTAFMAAAEASGAETANGLGMLLHQGARSFSIWTGREAPVEAMRKALEQEVYG